MKQRWLVVIVGLPALLAVLLACPAWATMLVVCGIAGIAAYELLHTAGENVPADFYWGLVTSVVMQEIWLFWERASGVHAFPISTVTLFRWILVMGAFLSAVVYYGKEKPFTFHDVAVTIVGGIVFPAMYSCIFLLRMDENYGKLYVLAPFCVAFVGDALSMYFGMWFGKRKMAPHVSPHKTWATIDSATLMNKGLEIIEAMRLYRLPLRQVDAVIHRQSIVHSLVEFHDGAMLAQLGTPDMKLPIRYAMTYPNRAVSPAEPLDLLKCPPLTFAEPDEEVFRCLKIAKQCAAIGNVYCAAMNGANEEAVAAFLCDEIGICAIPDLIEAALDKTETVYQPQLSDILEADRLAREVVREKLN